MTNPFATRFLRPGSIPFRFACNSEEDDLLARLHENGLRGAIVGPHGSGKSSLLAHLQRRLAQDDIETVMIRPPIRTDRLMGLLRKWGLSEKTSSRTDRCLTVGCMMIDGYQALSRIQASSFQRTWGRLRKQMRASSSGLLVTSHTDVWLPTLARRTPSALEVTRILSAMSDVHEQTLGERWWAWRRQWPLERIEAALCRTGYDMRELLFQFYDDWQQGTIGSQATELS